MSNKLKITWQGSSYQSWVLIDCLENNVIDRWFQSAKIIYSNGAAVLPAINPALLEIDHATVANCYQLLLSSIDKLKDLGVPWPEIELEHFNFSQEWCNKIHRRFTTMIRFKDRIDFKSTIRFNIDNNESFNKALHDINNYVHILENYCITEQKELYDSKIKYFSATPLLNGKTDKLETYGKFYDFEKDDFQYHTFQHYDVIFSEEVLGKTLLRSYFDNDEPKNVDTAGYAGWYGSFFINLDNIRNRIYESEHFNNWLAKHKLKKSYARADFPIGNISASSHALDAIWQMSTANQFISQKIEFL